MHSAVWRKSLIRMLTGALLTTILLFAGDTANAQPINLSGKNIPFENILKQIRKQTGYNYVCKDEWAKQIGPITIDVNNMAVDQALALILNGKLFTFNLSNKTITIFPIPLQISITGRVTDPLQKPMSGVSITIKGTATGTTSNEDGEFVLYGIDPKSVLVFTYVGYEEWQEKVNSRNRILVKLNPESKLMDKATVSNGYQRIQQRYLTGSVLSLKMDSIIQPGLTTVDKMLEGRVPGLTYMINSGQPGAAPKLRIRGTSTILGTREPLWVVDGIVRTDPFPIPAERLNDLDFVNLLGNAISGINPHDIEDIYVLRDAMAAALYGVRAANGVIVITTKTGKPGPPTFNYNVTSRFTARPRYTDKDVYVMNSAERVDVSREMIQKRMSFRGSAIEGYEQSILDYYNGIIDYNTYKKQVDRFETMNTDWLKAVTRDAFSTDHSLSVSGGNTASTYRASLAYNDEPGVIQGESNKRYNALLNVRLSERKFKADIKIKVNKEERRYVPANVGVLDYALGTSRAIPLYNEDGSPYFYSTISSGFNFTLTDLRSMNILNETAHSRHEVNSSEYIASLDLNYNLLPGLQFTTTLSYTGGNGDNKTWFDENTNYVKQIRAPGNSYYNGVFDPLTDELPFGGELQQTLVKRAEYLVNGRLDFSRYVDSRRKHLVNAALGAEVTSKQFSSIEQTRRGYYPERGSTFAYIDFTKYPQYASWLQKSGQATILEGLDHLQRTFFTGTYVYDDRFVLTGSASSDFSNAFGARSNERFLPTWALGGKWNMHNDVLKQTSWIDIAALKFSFGVKGYMLPNETPYTIIKKGALDSYFGGFTSTVLAFPNPGLAWERTNDYSGAFEFSFFKGKLNGSAGVFYKHTSNAFLSKRVSAINGTTSYTVNGGILENKGIELALNFKPINNLGARGDKKGFSWRIDPQLGQTLNTLLNNKLKTYSALTDPNRIDYNTFLSGTVPIDGESINTFFSYRFKGLDPQFGFPVFYNAEPDNAEELGKLYNGLSKEQLFRTVMIRSGKREPVIQGSITNSFSWRNWMLGFTFTYSLGNKIRLMNIASGEYGTYRPTSQQNLRKEFTERWRYPGDEQHTNIPALRGSGHIPQDQFAWWVSSSPQLNYLFASDYYQMYDFSDLRVVNGDYLKLQNIALAYNIDPAQCKRWNLQGATINLSGTNLFTLANKALRGQDPTQSGSTPHINLSIRPTYALNVNLTF